MTNKSILKNALFLRLIIGSSASGFSTWGLIFLFGLMVANNEMAATQLGLVLGIRITGFQIGVLFGGVLADSISRRRVILIASVISMLATGLIMLGLVMHVSLLYIGAMITGLGQGGCRPAYQAMVPQVVDDEYLQAANAWMGLSIRLINLLGPTITSAIVLAFGSIPAFMLLIVMWGISAFLPPWITEESHQHKSFNNINEVIGNVFKDLVDGLVEARRHPWFIWSLAALTIVIAVGYSATNIILPLVSDENGGLALMTKCITFYTLGGVVAAIVFSKFQPKQLGWYALIGLASYGFAPISLLFTNITIIALMGYFIAGFGIEMFNVLWFTAVQREVPASHLARISALDFLCSYGLASLGLVLIAPAANVIGHNNVLLICGLTCLIIPIVVILFIRSSKHYSTS